MLTARRVPRACQSCRLQLLSLFEHGFTSSATNKVSRIRPRNFESIALQPRRIETIRGFSTTPTRDEDQAKDQPVGSNLPHSDTEAVVKQARQTFGETLPKDYLSTEEYVLYERLYGPPLRETKADDLEYIPGEDDDASQGKIRNVLLKVTADGEYEEVEFDPELGFSVIEEEPVESEAKFKEIDQSEPSIELSSQLDEVILHPAAEEEAVSTVEDAMSDAPFIRIQGQNQREIDVIARLQRDMDEALSKPIEEEEELDEEYEEEDEGLEEDEEDFEEDEQGGYISSDDLRTHPHTKTGRFGTSPSTLTLPNETFVTPISELLERTNIKHLTEAAESAFGGKGLPNSSLTRTPRISSPQKHIGLDASQHRMTELEADAYLAAVMPGTYASAMSTLVEVRKRLGSSWIRNLISREGGQGPRVLDAGSGGAGAVAWKQIVQAEWDTLREEGVVKGEEAPTGKRTVLTGASTLRHRVSKFLDNTTFLPRLPDYIHSSNSEAHLDGAPAQGRKSFDVIIAPHTLFPLKEDFRRRHMVHNLWSLLDPNGGVLIMIEKGVPRGFEAIAFARSLLLESHIASPGDSPIESEITSYASDEFRPKEKEEGMIIAPCTNHSTCPMYPVPGLSSGRKDFCHFDQRYIRPNYLQRILGASSRNHEDVKYSYIAVRRGVDARRDTQRPLKQGEDATIQAFEGYEDYDLPNMEENLSVDADDIKFNSLSLPRLVLPALKRRGHVTLDLCTPSGELERWTIPKSFSKAAHRDARKSKWGDLWALGAKTRVRREPRLGRLGEDDRNKTGKKGIRDGRVSQTGKKPKKNKFNIIMGRDGMQGIKPALSQTKFVKKEKRTKGGRIWKEEKPIGEDDL